MSRKIENYFKSKKNDELLSADPEEVINDEAEYSEEIFFKSYSDHHVGEYEKILLRNKEAKEAAKIVLSGRKGTGSVVWSYFGTLTIRGRSVFSKFRFCKICFEMEETTLKGFSVATSTSNHITHLRSVHEISITTKTSQICLKKTDEALSGSSSNIFKNKSDAKFVNGRRIAEMCCTDLQAFNIVERKGFQKYAVQLKPDLEFPRARTVATTALQDVYELYEKIVKEILSSSPENISLVLDLWTDNFKKMSYVNIKVHYCKNFEIISASLKTEYFAHPHTGSRIADTILKALKEFKLDGRTIHAVSDGGTNIIAALRISNIIRYDCMAHSLHRFLMHDVMGNPEFKSVKEIGRKLKDVYKKLSYASEELASIQKAYQNDGLIEIILQTNEIAESLQLEEEFGISIDESYLETQNPTTIKNSNDTRWNTLLLMFRSFTKNFDAINIALINAGKDAFIFNEMEKKLVREFTEFLAIFEKATVYLQGRNYPTVCSNIFFFENIISQITSHEILAEFGISIQLYHFAKHNLKNRFRIKKIHVIAALMDPCQRNWPALNKWLKKIPKRNNLNLNENLDIEYDEGFYITREELIYKELQKVLNDSPPVPVTTNFDEPGPSKKTKMSAIRREMIDFMASQTQEHRSDSNIALEIKAYFDAPREETECLEWWKEKEQVFPKLSKLAEFCFGIPATSASSEEAFSVAGACITAKRSRLSPFSVKRQLFVHDNNHLVEPILKQK